MRKTKIIIVSVTTTIVVIYALFFGIFLGVHVVGFIVCLWIALISFSRVFALPARVALILTVASLLVLIPVHLDFSSYQRLLESAIFTFQAAANLDYFTSFQHLPPFWWQDLVIKYVFALILTALCAAACAKSQKQI